MASHNALPLRGLRRDRVFHLTPMVRRLLLARKRAFFSIGRKEGGYVRAGRLVLWWYGFRRDSELCAVWWLDRKHRTATNGVTVKPPWCSPLYSEDYGKHRPYLRLFGWRVLSVKYDR